MDWAEVGTLVALLAAGALLSGFLAGLLGIGGGAVTVPVLFQVLTTLDVAAETRMQIAIGTSLALIIPTSIRSLRAHLAKGAVDTVLLRQWIVTVPLGAMLGGAVANLLPSDVLEAIFAAIALVLGLRMLIGKLPFLLGRDLPGRVGRTVAGLVIGGLSAIMGIGGGVLNNTFMTLYGRTMHQAVATSAGVGVLIAVPGVVPFVVGGWGRPDLPPFSLGNVSLAALAILIPLSMPTVKLGATLAHRLTRRQLEIGFGLFLLTVSVRFIASAL
ncbi:sulfite exporter TauE/SafE family protein [Aureimonas sp. AU22]|uniref:sulfite exporter TauE/SafE family protein n=1 Tax=Aureimonas sp. AU22 TaxID=1638162 RepID=UPI0007802811|nr:sulfite exporter TauE/SafE family protein [Aureimonas sp. AU22]